MLSEKDLNEIVLALEEVSTSIEDIEQTSDLSFLAYGKTLVAKHRTASLIEAIKGAMNAN